MRCAGNCRASTNDETTPADDIHIEYLSAKRCVLRSEIGQRIEFIVELHDVGAAGRKAERTNDVGADQIRVSKRDLIVEVIDRVRVDGQGILPVESGPDVELSCRKTAKE